MNLNERFEHDETVLEKRFRQACRKVAEKYPEKFTEQMNYTSDDIEALAKLLGVRIGIGFYFNFGDGLSHQRMVMLHGFKKLEYLGEGIYLPIDTSLLDCMKTGLCEYVERNL